MTHFRTVVFVPRDVYKQGKERIEQFIAEQMAPYIEEGTGCCMPQYLVFQIKHKKKDIAKDAKKLLSEKWLTEEPERLKKYTALYKAKKYVEMLNEWDGSELNEAGDTGHYTNPNSFYDYYSVGGRWSGVITGKPKNSKDGFNFGSEYEDLDTNTVKVSILLKGFKKREKELKPLFVAREEIAKAVEEDIGYAIPFREFFKDQKQEVWSKLYKDVGLEIGKQLRSMTWGPFYNEFLINKIVAEGQVFEADDVGWWGMSRPKMSQDDWKKIYLRLLEKHKDDYAVALDCHV